MNTKIDYGETVMSGLLTRYNRMSSEDYERIFKSAKDWRPPQKKIMQKQTEKKS